MKSFGIWAVLGALLPMSAVAEPIPAEVRVHSLRALNDGAEVIETLTKRALTDDLYGDSGSGPRYWAWSKLAYDDEYNSQEGGKNLQGGSDRPWAKLSGSEIFVKGFKGPPVHGLTPWGTITGMKVVVGQDKTNKVIVMAFIGSNDVPTFKEDLKFPQVTTEGIDGRVETGFNQCYSSVYNKAFEWTKEFADANNGWDIVITGHSLGGATAHIAAVSFAAMHPDLASRMTVFTYGAPRAGDLTFQNKLAKNQGNRMANFQHKDDLVPLMPPIHALSDTYANPAMRYVFNGGSWNDQGSWSPKPTADEETHRIQGIVNTARDLYHGFSQHKNYFPSGGNTKRGPMALDGSKRSASALQKREPPSGDDFRYAEGLVGQMRQSNELKASPLELTPKLQEFTEHLKMVGEQGELLTELNNLNGEDERVRFLKVVEIVAMEQ